MFEKYTEKARRVIFFARHEVTKLGGAAQIGIDHLFLGLLREHEGLISPLLPKGSAVDAIRNEIRRHAKGHARILPRILRGRLSLHVDVPLSADATKALAYAAEESITLGHAHVRAEHLLLGLMRIKDSFIEKLLRERGVDLSHARNSILNKLREHSPS